MVSLVKKLVASGLSRVWVLKIMWYRFSLVPHPTHTHTSYTHMPTQLLWWCIIPAVSCKHGVPGLYPARVLLCAGGRHRGVQHFSATQQLAMAFPWENLHCSRPPHQMLPYDWFQQISLILVENFLPSHNFVQPVLYRTIFIAQLRHTSVYWARPTSVGRL